MQRHVGVSVRYGMCSYVYVVKFCKSIWIRGDLFWIEPAHVRERKIAELVRARARQRSGVNEMKVVNDTVPRCGI